MKYEIADFDRKSQKLRDDLQLCRAEKVDTERQLSLSIQKQSYLSLQVEEHVEKVSSLTRKLKQLEYQIKLTGDSLREE